jgi:hypothetical protein
MSSINALLFKIHQFERKQRNAHVFGVPNPRYNQLNTLCALRIEQLLAFTWKSKTVKHFSKLEQP